MPALDELHDLDASQALRTVFQRHGDGPYSGEDLATLTGHDLATVRRALADMTAAGLVTDPPDD